MMESEGEVLEMREGFGRDVVEEGKRWQRSN